MERAQHELINLGKLKTPRFIAELEAIEDTKQFDELLQNTQYDYTYLLEQTFHFWYAKQPEMRIIIETPEHILGETLPKVWAEEQPEMLPLLRAMQQTDDLVKASMQMIKAMMRLDDIPMIEIGIAQIESKCYDKILNSWPLIQLLNTLQGVHSREQ